MKLDNHRSALHGFIATQLAVVIAIITGGVALMAYEWRSAHPVKVPGSSAAAFPSHHHKHKHHPEATGNPP
jgi:hypothetical protein